MLSSFDHMLEPIDRGAAAIEQTFLAAGQGLGKGLDTFEGISRDLAELLGTLQGGSMASASAAIGDLAQRLMAVSGALPRDAAALQELAAGNDGIAKHLDALLEHIRMMTIIASSARIESAVFDEAAGLDTFTSEMSALTVTVRTAVGRCVNDHTTMTDRIGRLHAAQSGLDRDFRERLLRLANELSDTFALIEERQGRSRAMAEDLAGRSTAMARTTGTALMALQTGDSVRQRLEHIAAALRLAPHIASGRFGDLPVAEDERSGFLAALYALQAAQLADVAETFASDSGEIDALLQQLGTDAAALVTESWAVLGDAGPGNGSFLSALRARLADAAELVGTCDRARHAVAEAMVSLRADVAELSRTIAELGVTTRDLIVVGINAGLKAARLGAEGRSLMVIADEMKRLAGLITAASSQLVSAYEALVLTSRSLDRGDESAPEAETGTNLLSIAADLEVSDKHMSGFVTTLQGKAQQFDTDMTDVRAQFRATVSDITALRRSADLMAASADTIPPHAWGDAASRFETLLWPHYTMAREREIHAAVLGGEPAEEPPRLETSLDDLLFAEAV